MEKIIIASDHAGFRLKEKLVSWLITSRYEVRDIGCFSEDSVDYPDYAHPLAVAVENGEYDYGITICGSGNGISMACNKHASIRSAVCWNNEISRLARSHNDANICALPGRFLTEAEAIQIVKVFLTTSFEGGRHKRRIDKIPIKTV
ncbi:MAG TPA: ribose 5-phosphate isomerase B [Bacteroidales bacterium]|nr:ribose 5-phosphate isomerase B [Bacteroidales bacterium]MBP8709581.1 ribose 5-phosphate isomerase B [Bacteroidales bacterium]HMT65958.1 ribose 5-phosphate isomerase B [Bacteroidales bacterium]HNV65548.1 ribose 5-phosphate isomerase B [Bacteroidales bacterium]HNY56911.1 ribose 5-phosphate isomerase B [Bacteroidales bacterium]